ncbi:glycosyl hydrolase [Sunxiuqinia sp. A32]|uniref:glycosyl hydrolase n=1 Tax=Sunxiuqinia sp. A32 TaxID=3461496 RepID=UPI0040466EE6
MRFINVFVIILMLLLIGCEKNNDQPEWQKKYTDTETVREMFANPPMFYAPHAFWFWDDTIRDENFAASMIDEMAKQRLNPGYAHPRSSMDRLNPKFSSLPYEQYLEEPWFNSFGNALQKAKDYGLTLGYCDEYDWPSGQAAGRVLKQHPELEAKYLDWQRHEVEASSTIQFDSIDFAVAARLINQKIDASSLQLVGEGKNLTWSVPEGEWVVYTYTKKFHAGLDGGKVNYLDPKLMEAFIPLVHEQYAKRFGDEMGNSIPGVFVDNEGDYGWRMAWSEYLPKRYQEMKGQDIRLWLPLLTEKDSEGLYAKARCDWFEVVSDVYENCYFTPMVDWLSNHNMYYISNLWEESLLLQAAAMGDFMRVTRKTTMPGTDCLLMKSQDVHDFKEVQTIAELEDRPFMSEIMGVAGWEQTPEMMKMTINSITAFGVNHVVPHGINLNRKVETDPFPPDWFIENPYWPYLRYWTDFSRRASFITRQSKLVADVLLYNPQESIWANSEGIFSHDEGYTMSESSEVWDKLSIETNQIYSDAMREMNKNNIDFLIADKYYLNDGKVESIDKLTKININDHEFSALVLPPVCVISHVASTKILEFAENGGVVIILGELPQGSPEEGLTDNVIINQMKALMQLPNVIDLSVDKNKLARMVTVLNERLEPQIRLENSGRLYTAHRKIATTDFYWLANNTDTVRNFSAWLKDGEGVAEIWNCETGEITTVHSGKDNGYNRVSLTLQPYEGYWLVFNPDGMEFENNKVTGGHSTEEIILNDKWTVSYPGVDTIYRTSARSQSSTDKEINESKLKLGFNDSSWEYSSFISGKKSLAKKAKMGDEGADQSDADSYVYWRINVPVGAKTMIFPGSMNGTEIWIDGKKEKLSVSSVKLPDNAHLAAFARLFEEDTLPTCPLKFVVEYTKNCTLRSWYEYGLEQYTGYVDYETNVNIEKQDEKVYVDLGKVKYMAEVFINDQSVGARLWPPFKFDISSQLRTGDNKIRIRIGNLMVNEMWKNEDMGTLRTWGWIGNPDFNKYNAGLFGPITLVNQ